MITTRCVAVLGLAAAALSCAALPSPASAAGDASTVSVSLEGDRLRMTDTRTGETIMATDDLEFHFELSRVRPTIQPDLEIVPVENGFDVIAVYENNRTVSMPLGAIQLDGFRIADGFRWRDFGSNGRSLEADPDAPAERFRFGYPHGPQGIYSPVAVVETDDLAIGLSFLYPMMEYRHDVRAEFSEERGAADTWRFRWKLSNLGRESDRQRMSYEGLLAPGERRTYKMAVRVTGEPERWLETLEPYRRFFQDTYGPVAYERDARPVKPVSLAGNGVLSAQNPYGFRQEQYRPDLYGFGPLLDWVGDNFELGARTMFWQPSGLQLHHRDNNFPFKFASFWLEGDRYGHAMGDAPLRFRQFKQNQDVELGFWWGRATRVTSDWDVEEYEDLDPANLQHREIAFAELDAAVAAGATMIGLDAFGNESATPVWQLVEWMQIMRDRYPQLKFITEKHKPDVLHRLGPTFYQAYRKDVEAASDIDELRLVHGPLYLADLLIPGHETWLALRETLIERTSGVDAEGGLMQQEYHQALGWGYVPVVFSDVAPMRHDEAAESWRFTVPEGIGSSPDAQPGEDVGQVAPLSREAPPSRRVQTHTKGR